MEDCWLKWIACLPKNSSPAECAGLYGRGGERTVPSKNTDRMSEKKSGYVLYHNIFQYGGRTNIVNGGRDLTKHNRRYRKVERKKEKAETKLLCNKNRISIMSPHRCWPLLCTIQSSLNPQISKNPKIFMHILIPQYLMPSVSLFGQLVGQQVPLIKLTYVILP